MSDCSRPVRLCLAIHFDHRDAQGQLIESKHTLLDRGGTRYHVPKVATEVVFDAIEHRAVIHGMRQCAVPLIIVLFVSDCFIKEPFLVATGSVDGVVDLGVDTGQNAGHRRENGRLKHSHVIEQFESVAAVITDGETFSQGKDEEALLETMAHWKVRNVGVFLGDVYFQKVYEVTARDA